MAFSDYANLASVLKSFSLHYQESDFGDYPQVFAPDNLQEEIRFNLTELLYDGSEAMICEASIKGGLEAVGGDCRSEKG